MSTADLLERALRVIEDPDHWTKGSYRTLTAGGVQYCAVGAVGAAVEVIIVADEEGGVGGDAYDAAIYALAAAVTPDNAPPLPPGAHDGVITIFNDEPETTHAEVVAAFQRAIREARAREAVPVPVPEPVTEQEAVPA